MDEHYNGLALDEAEGDRIAASMGDADVVFMRNHGVMVTGPSVAEAWDDLYYLERACEVQRLALSTGRALKPVSAEIAEATARQMRLGDRGERASAFGEHQADAGCGLAAVSAMRAGGAIVLAGWLCGCTLIDQNTFNPHAKDAPVVASAPATVTRAPLNPPPLLLIGTADAAVYADSVVKAVAAARARKAGVVFDVVEMQPAPAPEVPRTAEAEAVAKLIVAQGVRSENVRLVARPEAGAPAGEIRVYVH